MSYVYSKVSKSCLPRRAVFVRSYLEFGDSVGIASSMVIVEVGERYVRESPGFSSELNLLDFFPSGNRMR